MEADDDGRKLRWRADAWRTGIRRLRDQPVGGFAAPVEPGAARGQQMVGSIDPRCETLRGTHWPVKVAGVMGWTAPYGIECARMRLLQSQTREPSVNQIIRIGMDTSKHI